MSKFLDTLTLIYRAADNLTGGNLIPILIAIGGFTAFYLMLGKITLAITGAM